MYPKSARPDTLMRRLRTLLAATTLALAATWQANALTIELDADLLKDASGNPMPSSGLLVLVASTDSTFNGPTPLSFVSGDDVVVGKLDLSAFATPGVVIDAVSTSGIIGKPIMLYWYPTLNINSTAPGQNTPYGSYTDAVGIDGSMPWVGGSDAATITLKFLTQDADTDFHSPGTNPSAAGLASSTTPTPIVINAQPASQTQNYASTTTFSVDASGTSLVYRWRKNGVNLSDTGNVLGSATSSLTLSSVTASDVASYSVFITNSSAFLTSSSATLAVIDPSITTPPASTAVNATGNATFSAVAVGSGTLTYQWKKGGSVLNNGSQPSGATVSGATTSAVTISGVQQSDAANYSVLVTGSGGTTTSSAASLTVNDIAPVFSSPTADSTTTIDAGGSITLSAAATGSAPITYHWKKGLSNLADGNYENGATVSGATTGTLTLTGVLAGDAGTYVCDAHNGTGDTLSSGTTINVNDPIISVQPQSFTGECGDVWPCLSVTAVGSTNLSYQWFSGATAITDATNASLCFDDNSFGSAGSYSVIVSNVFGNSITSSVATVTVVDSQGPFVNILGGHTATLCKGLDSYNDAGATAFDDCDGTVAVIPTGSVDTNALGDYTITYTATDSHGNSSSDTRVVTVQDCTTTPPGIALQPTDKLKQLQGTNVVLSVGATGPSLSYQWYEEGVAMAGKTDYTNSFAAHSNPASFHLTNVQYYVIISNTAGSVTSSVAHVTVVVDKATPTLTLKDPKANARAAGFVINGTAADANGNAAKLIYYWDGQTVHGNSDYYTNDLNAIGAPTVTGGPASRTITGFALNNPPHGGTNILNAWVQDLAGKTSTIQKRTVFWQKPHTYALTVSGNGTGTVNVTTKGVTGEHVQNAPTLNATLLGSDNTTYNLQLFEGQQYMIKFTPSLSTNPVAPNFVPRISSVVSNVPAPAYTGSTNKPVTLPWFQAGTSDVSATVYFNRNHVTDMAGAYSGVFSETGHPTELSSGLLSLTVVANGKLVAKVLNPGQTGSTVQSVIHGDIQSDGSIDANNGTYRVNGYLDWANSKQAGGVKQFIGQVSLLSLGAGWISDVTADRFEKQLLAATAGKKSLMIIPPVAGSGPTGESYATIKDSANSRTFNFSLADDELPIAGSVTVNATASGRYGIFLFPKFKATDPGSKSVLFGTWDTNSGNTVTLNWVKPCCGQLRSAFSIAPVANISYLTNGLTGKHTVGITNGTLQLSYVMDFGSGTPAAGTATTTASQISATATNIVKVIQTPTGTLNVTFANGNPAAPKTTVGHAAVLEDAQTGGGYFLPKPTGSTDTGIISIGPKLP